MSEGIDEAALEEGIELFNQQRFFDAHEVWESGWKKAEGEAKLFFQCLIQIAAALLHAERGNPRGAKAVADKARKKLTALPSFVAGIHLRELLRIVDGCLADRNGAEYPKISIIRSQLKKR